MNWLFLKSQDIHILRLVVNNNTITNCTHASSLLSVQYYYFDKNKSKALPNQTDQRQQKHYKIYILHSGNINM